MRFINEITLKLKNMVSRTVLLGKENYQLAKKEHPQIIPSLALTRTAAPEKRRGGVRESGLARPGPFHTGLMETS